ncbi:hypothetical protein BU26DRAFT_298086 [Trematosphaeria pertusa]|uniref:Uncharacterized protein n=1 Tax=Trematosphaeria pertusa TaxID=390896 RepID=A0A6A6IL85_9PLEO|nr:uncharacterized protein BU26DRAFT_298086 [Trematosphaeria pertusa]KAF2250253.1 hypothetical protein BU26DRAFT_298086 [Trematosphaeria pertusa]
MFKVLIMPTKCEDLSVTGSAAHPKFGYGSFRRREEWHEHRGHTPTEWDEEAPCTQYRARDYFLDVPLYWPLAERLRRFPENRAAARNTESWMLSSLPRCVRLMMLLFERSQELVNFASVVATVSDCMADGTVGRYYIQGGVVVKDLDLNIRSVDALEHTAMG